MRVRVGAALVSVAWVCAGADSTSERGGKENSVVLILTDDLDLMLNSSAHLPQTKALIGDAGAVLYNWFVHTPVCCPSRAELLTGRFFHNLRVSSFGDQGCMHVDVSPQFWSQRFFAPHLRDAGYAVGVFGKMLNTHNPRNVPTPDGVERWLANGGGDYLDPTFTWAHDATTQNMSEVTFDNCTNATGPTPCYSTAVIGNATLDWLRERKSRENEDQRPFFAFVAVKAPHIQDGPGWPVAVPAPWYDDPALFAEVGAPRLPNYNVSCPDHHWLVRSQPPITQEQAVRVDELYRSRLRSLLSVDDLVVDLVGTLEALGELHRTFIMFTSDHGYRFGQFRMPQGKWSAYENDLRVPMMLRGPGVAAGSRVSAPGTHVDMMPTLLGLLGRTTPATMDGADLSALLLRPRHRDDDDDDDDAAARDDDDDDDDTVASANTASRGALLMEYVGAGDVVRYEHLEDCTNNTFRAVRILDADRDLKFVEFTTSSADWNFTHAPEECELFDLSADPFELTNRCADAPRATLALLHEELDRLYRCKGQKDCASHALPPLPLRSGDENRPEKRARL